MGDLKFSCPRCGQHLSGDQSWAGRQIPCPACQQLFVIPGVAAPVGIPPIPAHATAAPVAAAVGVAPPPPPPPAMPPLSGRPAPQPFPQAPRPLPQAPSQTPFSNLSLVAFILSLLGIALPAVICGYIALGHFKRQPGLRGRGFAVAGLVIGYFVIALVLFFGALLVPAFLRAKKLAQERSRPGFVISPNNGPGVSRSRPPGSFRSGPAPRLTPVSTDPRSVSIPATPVSGTVNGTAVTLANGRLSNGILTLTQNDGFGSDYELIIFLFLNSGETVAGRSFVVPEPGRTMNPHVHARFKEGENGSNVFMVTSGYAMRLEFGQPDGNVIPGKIFLELPAEQKTKVSGAFEVKLQP